MALRSEFLDLSFPELVQLAENKSKEYVEADPFPSMYFDNFFNPAMLKKVAAEFPELEKGTDLNYNNPNEAKFASKGEYRFGEVTTRFAHFMNSQPFLSFLETLTGIKNLVPDPTFEGGGLHQIKPGGYLKLHADFNKHRLTGLDRRLNVLVYLNEDWDESYGGYFELWDTEMKACKKKILPLFNRMAMFNTTDFSYHGHPDPLTCPEGRSRRSMAFYYYSNGRPASEVTAGQEHRIVTAFKARPQDSGEMKRFNGAVYWAQQLTPPIVLKMAKSIFNK